MPQNNSVVGVVEQKARSDSPWDCMTESHVGFNFFCKAELVDLKQNQYEMMFCWADSQAFVPVRGNKIVLG